MKLTAESTVFNDEKVQNKFSELIVDADGIRTEVSKKVGNDEVISRINQSAESVQIEAEKIEFVTPTDNGAGIKVHTPNDDTDNYLLINADGQVVYVDGVSVAKYGATSKIGDTETWGSYYVEIADSGVGIIWKSAQAGADIPVVKMSDSGIRIHNYSTTGIQMDWGGIQGSNCVRGHLNAYMLGEGLRSSAQCQIVTGKYNAYTGTAVRNALFIVGNGESSDNRSNAFTVDKYGDVRFALDTTATSGSDKAIYDA
jgi:hypothetical protein